MEGSACRRMFSRVHDLCMLDAGRQNYSLLRTTGLEEKAVEKIGHIMERREKK